MNRNQERATKLTGVWRLIKDNQRTLKCRRGNTPCLTRFRVKEVEPGFYSRACRSCGGMSWFKLEPTGMVDGTGLKLLRFRWSDAKEAASVEAASIAEYVDLGISRVGRASS